MRYVIIILFTFLVLLSCEMPVERESDPDKSDGASSGTPSDGTPSNVTAELKSKNEIVLTWEYGSLAADEFIVERMITWNSTMLTHNFDDEGFEQIGSTTEYTFTDSNLEIETIYCYRVKARQADDKESDYSSKVWQGTPCIGHLDFVEQYSFESIGGISPADIAISPDGSNLYAADTGQDRLVVFKRDSVSGLLEYSTSYSDEELGIDLIYDIVNLCMSPDGRNLYVTSNSHDSLATFKRDTRTGALTFVDCIKDGDSNGLIDGLDDVRGICMSPDGKNVFATGYRDHALVVFRRCMCNGKLAYIKTIYSDFIGIDYALLYAHAVTSSPDGENIYVTSWKGIVEFTRDTFTGELTYNQSYLRDRDFYDELSDARAVVVSPDGTSVFVATAALYSIGGRFEDPIVWFTRDPEANRFNYKDRSDDMAGTYKMAVSPDGMNLYVTDKSCNVVVRRITPSINFVTHLHDQGIDADGKSVVVSPDGNHVYVAGGHSIVVYKRILEL
jgi:DNA-binding beta-propeller fold protein YncE